MHTTGSGSFDGAGDVAALGTLAGAVPGAQTVDRAEVFARVALLEATEGAVEVAVDSSFALGASARAQAAAVAGQAAEATQ
eukprot:4916835-Lingulodinium_polyedra.AAC.1